MAKAMVYNIERAAASIAQMVDEWKNIGLNEAGKADLAKLVHRRLSRFFPRRVKRGDMAMVTIEDGVLTMRVGVEGLAFAAVNHPDLMGYVHENKDCWKPPSITDPDKFAVDVMKQINAEDNGEITMLEAMLDSAIINAVESGSEHITLEGDTSASKPEPRAAGR